MSRKIFGDENAKLDANLFACMVPLPRQIERAPILRGRWGVGKTAAFLLRHRGLSDALAAVDESYRYIWYLDEGGLDTETLFALSQNYAANGNLLKRALGQLWYHEIVRAHALVLGLLHERYGSPKGSHWTLVSGSKLSESLRKPVWNRIADALTELSTSTGVSIGSAIKAAKSAYDEKLEANVIACLKDIQGHELYPVVVVEPIETPESTIEAKDLKLSQSILVSLLDLFIARLSYAPEMGRYFQVEVSIPWHRTVRDNLKEPQKLSQYSGHFFWSRKNLRNFINRRIEHEFMLVRRNNRLKPNDDPWTILFDGDCGNRWCGCKEDSFNYVLRHSHHRTRDLIRIARAIVFAQVDILRGNGGREYDEDDVLNGAVPSGRIIQAAIREGVEKAIKDSAADRLTEAKRRYPRIGDVVECLRGMESPFTKEQLIKRTKDVQIDTDRILDMMWESGFLGIEIFPKVDGDLAYVERTLGDECGVEHVDRRNERVKKYFVFEYHNMDSLAQTQRLIPAEYASYQYVIHPAFIEEFGIRATKDYPIGV